MTELENRKFFMRGGSQSVAFYSVFRSTPYVTFTDGRTVRSRTLRDVDALRRALVAQTLTTTPPLVELREEAAA